MYYKILYTPVEVANLQKEIQAIIGNRLPKSEIEVIIRLCQTRLINEASFNKEHFFLDLKGYLKYLDKEKKYNSYSVSSMTKNFDAPMKISVRERLLKQQGYWPAVAFGEDGHAKMSYLSTKKNEIIRFYYSRPAEFLYSKLEGTSETDINRAVANNLLTVDSINIPGEPMDVMERALPLSEVFDNLPEEIYDQIIDEIEKVKQSNILITDFIEGGEDNIGFVVRLDSQGNKRVYIVAFDLDLRTARSLTKENDQELLARVKQQRFADLQPKWLDYDYLIKFIPELRELATQFNLPKNNKDFKVQ